jgi:hypothetical protein
MVAETARPIAEVTREVYMIYGEWGSDIPRRSRQRGTTAPITERARMRELRKDNFELRVIAEAGKNG